MDAVDHSLMSDELEIRQIDDCGIGCFEGDSKVLHGLHGCTCTIKES